MINSTGQYNTILYMHIIMLIIIYNDDWKTNNFIHDSGKNRLITGTKSTEKPMIIQI